MQAKELLKLEEFQKGDMSHALGRAFLRVDELLVEEHYMEELKRLAGPKDKRWADLLFCTQEQEEGGARGNDCAVCGGIGQKEDCRWRHLTPWAVLQSIAEQKKHVCTPT